MNISPISIALMQSKVYDSLVGSFDGKTDDSWSNLFSLMSSNSTQFDQFTSDPLAQLTQGSAANQDDGTGLSATGRNMTLFDPESAYKMMTVINYEDVLYKAQFSKLGEIKSAVSEIQEAGQELSDIEMLTGNDSIKAQLQDFLSQYNGYIQRFNSDTQQGGLLDGTQAAEASWFELEQNLNSRFFGAKDGIHGLRDIGITVDSYTHMASLDMTKLDALLASNKLGVVGSIDDFSENFAKSASMLTSENNFILKQLDNLSRAIKFIADNKTSLQAEFGIGDPAKPKGQVAQALAAYNKTFGV